MWTFLLSDVSKGHLEKQGMENEQRRRPGWSSSQFGGVSLKDRARRSYLAGIGSKELVWRIELAGTISKELFSSKEWICRSYLAGASLQTGILRALWWERRAVRVKAWLPSVRKIYGQPMKPARKILGRSNEISEKKIWPKNVLRNLSDMRDELVLNIGDRCQLAWGASHTIASPVSFSSQWLKCFVKSKWHAHLRRAGFEY